MTESNL